MTVSEKAILVSPTTPEAETLPSTLAEAQAELLHERRRAETLKALAEELSAAQAKAEARIEELSQECAEAYARSQTLEAKLHRKRLWLDCANATAHLALCVLQLTDELDD